MKRVRNSLIAAFLTILMLLNTACGSSFDASAYVESYMKMITQGDVADYVQLTNVSEDEAQEQYQAMSESMKTMIAAFDTTEETQENLVNALLNVISYAKYTVQEAEKTDEGYDVDIEIEPITGLYDGMGEQLQTELQDAYLAGEVDMDTMYDWMFSRMAEMIEEKVDTLTYGEAQTLTIHLIKEDNVYRIDDEYEIGKQIGELLIDQSGMLE